VEKHVTEFLDELKEKHPIFARMFDEPKPPFWEKEPETRKNKFMEEMRELTKLIKDHPHIKEGDGKPMRFMAQEDAKQYVFENWGRTIKRFPSAVFYPTTVQGIQNIVLDAKEKGIRVRCAGYRHTWGDFYGENQEYFVSMLPEKIAADLPAQHPQMDPNNELQGVTFDSEITATDWQTGEESKKAVYRIGASTTNYQFRWWALDHVKTDTAWTVPINVIMVEITYGGSNAPVCHGAGIKSKTISDLVHKIQFVNHDGQVQEVDDPEQLKSAAGCFGLMGVVTAVWLKLDPMTFAKFQPYKTPVLDAIPPTLDEQMPKELQDKWDKIKGTAEYAKSVERFEQAALTDYYAEWFWFTFQDDAWVNTWKNDGEKDGVNYQEVYPSQLESIVQNAGTYIAELINQLFAKLPGWVPIAAWLQTTLLTWTSMKFLPAPEEPISTPLINTLHFQHGIQNMRVLDCELELPLPKAQHRDGPDLDKVRKAWWSIINYVYDLKKRGRYPMRLTLEMRLTHDSNVHLAPQKGNQWGTCSIEVLTPLGVPNREWTSFMNGVYQRWAAIDDQYPATDQDGNRVFLRPHWAKQWQELTIDGETGTDYFTNVLQDSQIKPFREGMRAIAEAGGYKLADMFARFGNTTINKFLGPPF
jgi:hypothetical protein